MQNFASRQDYTTVKGHYIPILYEGVDDSSPIDLLDGRRFYIQTYKFLLLGLLLDEDEFEVKPAIQRITQLIEIDTTTRKQSCSTTSMPNIPLQYTKSGRIVAKGSVQRVRAVSHHPQPKDGAYH